MGDLLGGSAFQTLAPMRRRLHMDCNLFQLGNVEREGYAKPNTVDASVLESMWQQARDVSAIPIVCHICKHSFPNQRQCDDHILLLHTHVCTICGAGFVCEEWVTRHVQERHDSYFAAMVARGMSVVRCACTCAQCVAAECRPSISVALAFNTEPV